MNRTHSLNSLMRAYWAKRLEELRCETDDVIQKLQHYADNPAEPELSIDPLTEIYKYGK